jgi:hypothetical protein
MPSIEADNSESRTKILTSIKLKKKDQPNQCNNINTEPKKNQQNIK